MKRPMTRLCQKQIYKQGENVNYDTGRFVNVQKQEPSQTSISSDYLNSSDAR